MYNSVTSLTHSESIAPARLTTGARKRSVRRARFTAAHTSRPDSESRALSSGAVMRLPMTLPVLGLSGAHVCGLTAGQVGGLWVGGARVCCGVYVGERVEGAAQQGRRGGVAQGRGRGGRGAGQSSTAGITVHLVPPPCCPLRGVSAAARRRHSRIVCDDGPHVGSPGADP